MNPKQILNNYRAGKMPRSVYRKGGSKGRKLPMAQFMVGDQAMNQGAGMGQGQTMLEQQTGPSQIEIANNVLAYANQLVEQGNYKDTRKGRQKAFDDAQIAHGLVTPKQKSNFLDYFNAVTGLLGPIATTYSTIANTKQGQQSSGSNTTGGMFGRKYGGPSRKLAKNQFRAGDAIRQAQPTTKDLIDKGGDMTPEMRNAFIKRMAMNEQLLRRAIQEQAAQQALMNQQASGLGDVEIGIQPEPASFYQDMMNAAMQQGMSSNTDPDLIIRQMLQQGMSSDVKRKGGAKKKRKAKYQNLGEKRSNLSPTEISMLMQGLSGTIGGTTILPETVITGDAPRTFSPVSSKLLPMEQKLLQEAQTYQPRQPQMIRGQLQTLQNMQNMSSGFGGKSNLSESGIPRAFGKGGDIKYRTKGSVKSGMGVPSATQRSNQMKYGGSMCRGLPGGPNEFIR